jgi:hypothetical protein
MRPSSRFSLLALLVLALAWSAPTSAAPHARPAKVTKTKQGTRAGARTTTVRKPSQRAKNVQGQSLRVRNSAKPAAKKKQSEHSQEVPAYAVKLRESLGKAIDAHLKKFPNQAEALPADRVLYHSVKETSHRELSKGKYDAKGLAMMGEWMTGGRYGGIWTTSKKVGLFGGEGWYSDKGSAAVRITLKKGHRFIDLDDPAQKQIYKDWKKLSGQDTHPSPKDLFQKLKDANGTPLAKRLSGIGAPTHGDFLVHMGIAGVIHYDTYGQGNPVLINPHAIEKVEF